jgi:hypothetical protein
MTPIERTRLLILTTIAIWVGFDLFTVQTAGVVSTISRVILAWSNRYPWVLLSTGILIGHLFFAQPSPQ